MSAAPVSSVTYASRRPSGAHEGLDSDAGKLVTWVATVLQRALVIVKRPRRTQGFQVLQWRWIVERTFGWLNRSRRLSKDFEALPETTETWIRIAMIQLLVRRLAARA